ncbi:restriction endonuclease [Rathayibacter sp. AY1C4]|uniref:NaeI family type II restriction endonuclease n=1 Tax=Rathayibacter sp. AY1C4 TaxID=2080537 RepID=UPI000CE76A99|nr:NaeI family type II restriction endonuclease [Rathayibacter sp. AY1C4]PPH21996.1 restriction endonuclease [Rathayibacter sp. AY1C4]
MADELSLDWSIDPVADETDEALVEVFRAFQRADPDGSRTGKMMRRTLDQLYDGQRTGRYSWAQLHKTERTHFGTLFEINLRREFDDVIDEGVTLDYRVAGHDVDCKFSQTLFQWMIPPEAIGHLLFVGHVNDVTSEFAVGIVRASPENLRSGANRDAKVGLNLQGRAAVRWLHRPGDLPPNVLLQADPTDVAAIFANRKSGQARVNELFRRVVRQRISRNAVATVAQQDDFMKRVRENGGARSSLRPEGYIILGGDYNYHRQVASMLGIVAPEPGEMVSVQVTAAENEDPNTVMLGGRSWRVAHEGESPGGLAPVVPHR